jgi:hypothetical protein
MQIIFKFRANSTNYTKEYYVKTLIIVKPGDLGLGTASLVWWLACYARL